MTYGNNNAYPQIITPCGENLVMNGLTKREYFAAMALQGLLVQNLPVDRALNEVNGFQLNSVAQAAVKCADALIDELNKPQP